MTRNALVSIAILLVALAAPGLAVGSPILVHATGTVTNVLTPDPFGTQVGNQITLDAVFDSSTLVDVHGLPFGPDIPGLQFASLAGPGANLLITLGARHWTAADDPLFNVLLFKARVPHVVLLNGAFIGLNYLGIGPSDDVFMNDTISQLFFGAPLGEVLGGNSDPNAPPFWVGAWDLARATVTPVPEPSSLLLLGTGAFGLLRRWQLRSRTASRG